MRSGIPALALLAAPVLLSACGGFPCPPPDATPHPGPARESTIIVAGVRFPAGTRVVTWKDAGGYDAYEERCHFHPEAVLPSRPAAGCDVPRRYGSRFHRARPSAPRGESGIPAPDLAALREKVDQVVLHYDVCGTSRRCFEVLHDVRGLSVHFLLDVDGTVYQTLDLAERARHATIANDRSVGIEIAQIGAYPGIDVLWRWYVPDGPGRVRLRLPEALAKGAPPPGFAARPRRQGPREGVINGRRLLQYDFTRQQYEALACLLAALHAALPRIALRVPRAPDGSVRTECLQPAELAAWHGVIGHHHVQAGKVDPGPALDWDLLLRAARRRARP